MKNIYQTAREAAGITQERAAELIGLSVESIRSYETEKRVPSDETVIKMIEIYNANYLAYQHLKLKTQVGNAFLPDVHEVPLSNAALALIHNLHSCMEEHEEIIAITMDGNISQEELTEWQRIMKKYDDLYTAILEIQFSKK